MTARDTLPCPLCTGAGRIRYRPWYVPGLVIVDPCHNCNGTGSVTK